MVAWPVLLIAAVHPPHGLGIPICWSAVTTGAPCPGCGLTRSMSCALHGMFRESWDYHPFGMAFLAAFAGLAIISVLPVEARRRLLTWTQRRTMRLNVGYGVFITAFLTYGVARAVLHYLRFE